VLTASLSTTQSIDCSVDQQKHFDGLQVTAVDEHDQTLVDARMLGVASSAESRQMTAKSSDISTKKQSDYWLKRFMASFDKLSTILRRRLPRANTHRHMEAHAHHAAPQRSNTN
jgi:hypothetical protein